MADFADLKSIWTIGHSRGVAGLAGHAGMLAGLSAGEVDLLRRAALVHNIGRVTVPFRVWAKPGPLSRDESEQVRLHTYHSERVLDAAEGCGRWPGWPVRMANAMTDRDITEAAGAPTCRWRRGCWQQPKTCDHHIQSLYAKAGVSTRAAATLFALEHGLVSADRELRPNML